MSLVSPLWAVGLLALACGDDGGTAVDTGAPTTGATDPTAAEGSTNGVADTTEGPPDQSARPNWHEDIAPLVAEHCGNCHVDGGIAPFPLQGYEQTEPYAAVMALVTESGQMPPWHALETEECDPVGDFKHDARLSAEQIQLFADWADLGAPEGDPALAAPIPDPPSFDLPDPTITMQMDASVTIEPQGNTLDFFHCLSFDPGNTENVYIDGMQVIPGNTSIAHHVLVYVDLDGASASWPNGLSSNCGGGTGGLSNVLLVGGWVPGSLPMEVPEGVGILLPAGARLVFNYHYHASVTGPQTDDATQLAVRWQTTPPEYVSEFYLIGAPGDGSIVDPPFMIPAGASGHVEEIVYDVPPIGPADVRIFSVLNHMHKVGVDMKTSVIRSDGTEECLVQTPKWDFDWQRFYDYDTTIGAAFQIQGGDQVRVRCTYDNTLDNPSVVEALGEVGLDMPQDVNVGEGTLDEMCLAGIGVAVRLGL